jgi:hypothetical protein
MDITIRTGNKYIAEVWEDHGEMHQLDVLSEERYTEINQWCIDSLGYHARTAYHIFEFKKQADLEWFLLRWH